MKKTIHFFLKNIKDYDVENDRQEIDSNSISTKKLEEESKINKVETFYWVGKSEERYKYYVYEIPVFLVKGGWQGNYIFSRKAGDNFEPIFIGEGSVGYLSSLMYHPDAEEIEKRGATHVHVHVNSCDTMREREHIDLYEKYKDIVIRLRKKKYEA